MIVLAWILIVLLVVGWLSQISIIGKPREPLTGNVVALASVINAAMLVALIWILNNA